VANEKHVKRLKQGVADWNASRTGAKSIEVDLTDANLDGANLDGANLDGANLADATLDGTNLAGA
jgi:uncharacterized protein YjbI with pentapeptide repeats